MTNPLHSLLGIAAVFAVASTSAGAEARPRAPVECDGGTVHTAKDAARYFACESIVGDLRIEGTSLRDLSDFGHVSRISGSLTVTHNGALASLSPLAGLTSVRSVDVSHNPELDDLSGLDGLRRLERLVVRHNGIVRTAGLERLRSVGELVVADNPNLISLGGLDHVTHVRSVEITHNARLCGRLGLLPKVKRVTGELVVERNLGISQNEVEALIERAKPAATVALADD